MATKRGHKGSMGHRTTPDSSHSGSGSSSVDRKNEGEMGKTVNILQSHIVTYFHTSSHYS